MLLLSGTLPIEDKSIIAGTIKYDGRSISLGDKYIPKELGSIGAMAMMAASATAAEALGIEPPLGVVAGDMGQGTGSALLYSYLTEQAGELGASAVTLGLGFIITFNKPPLLLVTSPILVPLGHTLIALPFVIRSMQPALLSIPGRLREAAASLGASRRRVWFAVDWPIVARATSSAAVFAFTVSLGEFGATSLVVRPEYPTMPIAIARFLSQPGGMNYGQAMAMATVLMAVCSAGIFLIERMRLPGTGEF